MEDSRRIARGLVEAGLFRTWLRHKPEGWTLVSGIWSPFYVQLRPLPSHLPLLRDVAQVMAQRIERQAPDANRLVGIAMAGIPLAVAAALASDIPAAFTRKGDLGNYGEHSMIEGDLADGDQLVLIDDVVTGFTSKQTALDQIEEEARRLGIKVRCRHVVVVVDRAQGAAESARRSGVAVHSILRLDDDGLDSFRGVLRDEELEVLRDYVADPQRFQSPKTRAMLSRMTLPPNERES